MSTGPNRFTGTTPASSFEVPRPVEYDPSNIVENVYQGDFELPDYDSQVVATKFLQSRLVDEPRRFSTRVIATPTGRTLPKITRVDRGVPNNSPHVSLGKLLIPPGERPPHQDHIEQSTDLITRTREIHGPGNRIILSPAAVILVAPHPDQAPNPSVPTWT